MNDFQEVSWQVGAETHTARWRSENGAPPPKRLMLANDTLTADAAYKLACEGTALLWQSDFQNARQLLQALTRRIDKPRKKSVKPLTATEAFHLHRQAQAQKARTLGMLLITLDGEYRIPLRRAPDVQQACTEAYGPAEGQPSVLSLRELLGLIGAHEWRKKGVPIPALGGQRIHAHYGVFSPVRGEYVDLVGQAPLPKSCETAFDIGTGTGVLAAVLAKRGVPHVLGTDQDLRALRCAEENIIRLQMGRQIELRQTDLFPEGKADLVVCNPPWLPAKANAAIEYALYDPDSRMLRGFLNGLAAHLNPGGEGWLIISDLAEHLGLRTREALMGWIAEAGLSVIDRLDIRPRHSKAFDPNDPLFAARSREVTSLWRLGGVH